MKLIFLDIDGVLNHWGDNKSIWKQDYPIHPDNLANLLSLIDLTSAKIVLSSSWRFNSKAIQHLKTLFPILSLTPQEGRNRGTQIDTWLTTNDLLDIESFVILDDDSDMLDYQLPFFVQTNIHAGGLTKDHELQAQKILTLPLFSYNKFLVNRRNKQNVDSNKSRL